MTDSKPLAGKIAVVTGSNLFSEGEDVQLARPTSPASNSGSPRGFACGAEPAQPPAAAARSSRKQEQQEPHTRV